MPSTVDAEKISPSYRSVDLEQIQARSSSPFGMQFLCVPVSAVPGPMFGATTRSCDETSNDGSSKLDCIDDED